jgi:alpha-1,3-rhamnosyl/mannosyltransferase
LICLGADWSGAPHVHAEAARSPFAGEIRFSGFVDGDLLPTFYQAADAVAFPSLYEGFGLPVIEAMASGVPVACANASSLPEIAGDAALLFEPLDALQLSQQLERLLTDPIEAEARRALGLARAQLYSWGRAARETLTVLKAAAHEGATC